jgi:hypothetical protein
MIGGTLQRPKVVLQSDAQPPRTQSELLTLLAFGGPATSLTQPEGSSLASTGQPGGLVGQGAKLAMTRLEGMAVGVAFEQLQLQAGRALGADQFYITPGDAPELAAGGSGISNFVQSTRVEAGKYLNSRTFLTVQAYNLRPGARLEYRANPAWLYSVYTQPQVLLRPPSLDEQPTATLGSFGVQILRLWRF